MFWWNRFDMEEVERDFFILAQYHFQIVRIFLLWEAFQPHPEQIYTPALDRLKVCADVASKNGLTLMPTFFCGHMSGVNCLPNWMCSTPIQSSRFPVYTDSLLRYTPIRNYYTDERVLFAQIKQTETVCKALSQHPGIFAYDMGNESSNCCIPPDRSSAREWLKAVSSSIRNNSKEVPVTFGMHAEDLEENRNLWIQDAALYCDFLSMHGYPFYLDWVDEPLDPYTVPFLGIITRWLGEKPVMFQEFGAPTLPSVQLTAKTAIKMTQIPLFHERNIYIYYKDCLSLLQKEGMIGALAWCYADYSPDLWDQAPLKENVHERFFGLFRSDHHPREAVKCFENKLKQNEAVLLENHPWLASFNKEAFYDHPKITLPRMYHLYKQHKLKEH